MTPPKNSGSAGKNVSARFDELTAKVERLEGAVRQLLAERTREAILPTWGDIEKLKAEIVALKRRLDDRDS